MAVTPSITQGFSLSSITRRTDIAFALGLVAVLILLFMPVSTILLDMALALSILFSIMILFTALFIERPLEFSSFPTVLLVSTMIRLALDVAATRVILTHGHEGAHSAGKVIEAFGRFLMGGNFVIGIIVFAILIIVNFVVITKGSGRIAEVSARFSLDAMPGKQMAVDADLSAGLIDESEAKLRRKLLEDESNFFGSMDGAAKFVRGDAIAGLLITFINIIGGIIIGVGQMDLSFGEALTTYTLLTVGDGLVSQVPALIVSTAAGMLVSKAGVEGSADKALISQLSGNPTVLGLSSFLMMILASTPGMPGFPFFILAIACGIGAWRVMQSQAQAQQEALEAIEKAKAPAEEVSIGEEAKIVPGHIDYLRIEIGYGLLPLLNGDKGTKLTDQIKNLRKQLAQEIGFVLPSVRIQDNIQVNGMSYLIRVKELEAGRGDLRPDHFLVMNPNGEDILVEGEATTEPTFGLPACWITESQRSEAERLGYTIVDASTVMTTHLTEIVKENLAELLTYVETQKMLDELGDTYKKLLNDLIPSQISLGGIQRILQNLVSERVSIRDLATIIEAISEGCGYSRNVSVITEHVRQRLSRQITHSNLDENHVLKMVPLTVKWDQAMNDALLGEGEVRQLALSPSQIQEFIAAFKTTFDRISMMGDQAVLVVNPTLRPYVRSIIARVRPSVMVLGQNEIHPSAIVQNVGQV
ncbi:flagellar biosynthesis protein FlhA [Candidatus Odyssella acanthamoebae]|uniref:Flagellar biosynthesis protein FlhA n=1 Tax=Candidatus Odyssella acanthamoebae TaxID=91604 RepID=A0A077AY08_9PROT|nr:flagellar biosynthesis protein FlhA [Candidatus Paracaedibacter acanthamoebae]AIK96523.1 flagellar biosynthesis protein FlhA [Candidatus Paracaedibacter acanthamoebae]